MRLLQSVYCVDQLIVGEDNGIDFDMHAPLASLPMMVRCRYEAMVNHVPYLHTEAQLVALCKTMLSGTTGLRVAINWQGNANFTTDRFRSIRLSHFQPLGEIYGVALLSLQQGRGI